MKPTLLPFSGALLPGGLFSVAPLSVSLFCVISSIASSAGAESLAPQAAPVPHAPELASLRLSVGFGGGSVGFAARAAADAEYWVSENAGIGLLGALGAQSAMLGSSFSYAFLGPALTLRGSETDSETGYFATAAFGFMNGGYTQSDGDFLCFDGECESVEYDIRAPGIVLDAGVTGRAGAVDLGGAIAVDLISVQLDKPRWLNTVTLNFTVGIPIL